MPYQWTVQRERQMLLVIAHYLNPKPSNNMWKAVAGIMGEGLTPSAVSQKYHKMRKDAVGICNATNVLTPPATPTKRVSRVSDGKIAKPASTKKQKEKPILKEEEDLDGGTWSSSSSFLQQLGSPSELSLPFVMEQLPPTADEAVWTEVEAAEVGGEWPHPYQQQAQRRWEGW